MGLAWFIPFLLVAVGSGSASREVSEHVDLIELNHFHDCLGRHVYDQVIFYEWAPDAARYHVRAWCLIEDRDLVSRRPTRRYSDNRYEVQWHDRDQNLLRILTSTHFRESWTQIDPERSNKKVLDERMRTLLVRRSVAKQDKLSEAEEVTLAASDPASNEIDSDPDQAARGANIAQNADTVLVAK